MFEQHKTAIQAAAVAAAPNELCGGIHAGQFVVLENAAPDPLTTFAFTDADTAKYMLDPLTEAIVHSHPATDLGEGRFINRLSPSITDMRQQLATALPWIIAAENRNNGVWEVFDWGLHTLDLPILERPFRHGVEDCYEVIRKWHWQYAGVELLACPRDDLWWDDPMVERTAQANFYMDLFQACGAERVYPNSPGELRPGDVFLYKLGTKDVYNHGGVFLGNGLVAHHPPSKLSVASPVGPWFKRLDVWLRR